MSKLTGKGDDGFRGKNGNYVVYDLNGMIVKRSIGTSTNPFTEKQKANYQITSLVCALLKPVKDFIEISFDLKIKKAGNSQYNLASSYNRLNAIKGVYPDQSIDFTKVLFSKGNMPVTADAKATLTADGLEFTWNTVADAFGFKATDRVMLMAYFPEKEFAVYLAGGNARPKGIDQLVLPLSRKPVVVETYLSFISVNHKSVANSVYTGQFIWNPLE